MARGWLVSLGLSGLVLGAAVVVSSWSPPAQMATSAEIDAASDPCFSYGRFECCMRPDEL